MSSPRRLHISPGTRKAARQLQAWGYRVDEQALEAILQSLPASHDGTPRWQMAARTYVERPERRGEQAPPHFPAA